MSEQNVQVTQALEPCPFCWRDERHLDISLALSDDYYVDCGCGAQGPIMPSRAEAIAAWNHRTRAEPDLVEAARDVVTDAEEFGILDGLHEDGSPIDTLAVCAEPIRRLRAALTRADGEVLKHAEEPRP